jgi:hypothetical protein
MGMNKQLITTMTDRPFAKMEPLPLPPGNLFKRMLAAKVIAAVRRCRPEDVAAELWPSDRLLQAAYALKATSAPAITTVTGWAKELAAQRVADAVSVLSAAASSVEVMRSGLLLTWDGYGAIFVPSLATSANNASFVQEGSPIPVRQFATSAGSLLPYKVATIAALTREMIESSNAEVLITEALVGSSALAIDAQFFSVNAASAAAPAGIRNGITALTPSANADPFGAFFEDMASLIGAVGAVGGRGPFYLVSNAGRWASMKTRFVTETGDIIPVMSPAVGNDLIAIAPQAIAAAVDADPDVETVDAGVLVMDTAPGVAGIAGPERSLFQTDTLAIKIRWPVSWVVRSAAGVAWLTPAWK